MQQNGGCKCGVQNKPNSRNTARSTYGTVNICISDTNLLNDHHCSFLDPQSHNTSRRMSNGRLFSISKYAAHICLFIIWIIISLKIYGVFPMDTENESLSYSDSHERYGLVCVVLLYLMRLLSLLALPQYICNSLGLLLFNNFKDNIALKIPPSKAPFICFRVVTRGDYPALVKQNLEHNIGICLGVGLENFIFEVVTDKHLGLGDGRVNSHLPRETVVPQNYRTKTGAKFKSRALQYCLEKDVNILRDNDWIVHLDEETLMTVNSVHGILNFCEDGNHQFGQGVITYGQGEVVNWLTTLCDSFRVADDMGKLRFQFSILHKPLFGWKGSYVVTKAGAERKVTFDHGLEGSIAEDCFFGMIAYRDGYSFDFVEGEMLEKSPFTFYDFLKQRRRWLKGISLTVHSSAIPLRHKVFLASSLYAWYAMPVTTLSMFTALIFPLPKSFIIDIPVAFIGAVSLYMYMFGAIKSFSNRFRNRLSRIPIYLIGAILVIPLNLIVENAAVIMGAFSNQFEFYVVNKDVKTYIV